MVVTAECDRAGTAMCTCIVEQDRTTFFAGDMFGENRFSELDDGRGERVDVTIVYKTRTREKGAH